MIYYNGGTITPLEEGLARLQGRHAMISFARPSGSLHLKYMQRHAGKPILHHEFDYIVVPAGVSEYSHSVSNK
jgi:hypothetical protein